MILPSRPITLLTRISSRASRWFRSTISLNSAATSPNAPSPRRRTEKSPSRAERSAPTSCFNCASVSGAPPFVAARLLVRRTTGLLRFAGWAQRALGLLRRQRDGFALAHGEYRLRLRFSPGQILASACSRSAQRLLDRLEADAEPKQARRNPCSLPAEAGLHRGGDAAEARRVRDQSRPGLDEARGAPVGDVEGEEAAEARVADGRDGRVRGEPLRERLGASPSGGARAPRASAVRERGSRPHPGRRRRPSRCGRPAAARRPRGGGRRRRRAGRRGGRRGTSWRCGGRSRSRARARGGGWASRRWRRREPAPGGRRPPRSRARSGRGSRATRSRRDRRQAAAGRSGRRERASSPSARARRT